MTADQTKPNGSDKARYVVEIAKFTLSYLFQLQNDRSVPGVYDDVLRMDIGGTFEYPEEMRGRQCVVVLRSSRIKSMMINRPEYIDVSPGRIGRLKFERQRAQFDACLPHDAVPAIAMMLVPGGRIILHAVKVKDDGANIKGMEVRFGTGTTPRAG